MCIYIYIEEICARNSAMHTGDMRKGTNIGHTNIAYQVDVPIPVGPLP